MLLRLSFPQIMEDDNAVENGCAGLCRCSSSIKHFIGAKITVLHFLVASGDSNRIAKLLAAISTG